MFYAFFVMLAERFDKAGKKMYIDRPIRFLGVVQLFFVVSAMLALFEVSGWALGLAIFGLFLLIFYSVVIIVLRGLIQS